MVFRTIEVFTIVFNFIRKQAHEYEVCVWVFSLWTTQIDYDMDK